MRYAIFTDIHANLEALEAVLAKIDEIAQEKPIDEIWCLGDVVGYGPNPNECIDKLRERTNVIIAGNHDWAAIGNIDLEDFSEAARISAEWTAEQLTDEHREFLASLPEHIDKGEVLLVHGSPHGPLWEYLTSEVLAERSFQEFTNHFCFVGHTHVPIIFQQPDDVSNRPTRPLELQEALQILSEDEEEDDITHQLQGAEFVTSGDENIPDGYEDEDDDEDTATIVTIRPSLQTEQIANEQNSDHAASAYMQHRVANAADSVADLQHQISDDVPEVKVASPIELKEIIAAKTTPEIETSDEVGNGDDDLDIHSQSDADLVLSSLGNQHTNSDTMTSEEAIQNAEERLNQEIEELLTLLGLSQSMVEVTNEMIVPPIGEWQPTPGYRAIVNPGGVGQPRDGDPRAAFMIYDTEQGFTFYRISYPFEKTQQKIIKAGLPPYLATRLAYGR